MGIQCLVRQLQVVRRRLRRPQDLLDNISKEHPLLRDRDFTKGIDIKAENGIFVAETSFTSFAIININGKCWLIGRVDRFGSSF